MQKICGRCLSPINCQANQVQDCACSQPKLQASTLQFLQSTHYDCLCNSCLVEVDRLVAKAQQYPLPEKAPDFQENLHYYLDQGAWVMTEFYLLQRGYCCGNGCRHCAYGFQRPG